MRLGLNQPSAAARENLCTAIVSREWHCLAAKRDASQLALLASLQKEAVAAAAAKA